MSRKNVLKTKILDSQSLAASFISPPTLTPYLDNISYQINVTTTDSIGTFKVQASNDYENVSTLQPANAGTWVDLDIGGTPVVNTANDSILIDLNQLPFTAVRLVYTSSTAGTGTCDAFIIARQIGG